MLKKVHCFPGAATSRRRLNQNLQFFLFFYSWRLVRWCRLAIITVLRLWVLSLLLKHQFLKLTRTERGQRLLLSWHLGVNGLWLLLSRLLRRAGRQHDCQRCRHFRRFVLLTKNWVEFLLADEYLAGWYTLGCCTSKLSHEHILLVKSHLRHTTHRHMLVTAAWGTHHALSSRLGVLCQEYIFTFLWALLYSILLLEGRDWAWRFPTRRYLLSVGSLLGRRWWVELVSDALGRHDYLREAGPGLQLRTLVHHQRVRNLKTAVFVRVRPLHLQHFATIVTAFLLSGRRQVLLDQREGLLGHFKVNLAGRSWETIVLLDNVSFREFEIRILKQVGELLGIKRTSAGLLADALERMNLLVHFCWVGWDVR